MRKTAGILIILFFISCKGEKKTEIIESKEDKPQQSFFPVTNFLKGQVYNLQNKGLNPIKYTTENGKTDSAWLKVEDIPAAVQPFFESVIDSVNVSNTFKETTFHDATIDAYTFSYDPVNALPDSQKLQRWDVYVNPETNRVTRIYILKKENNDTQLQLTWQSEKFCKMVWIDESGEKPFVKKEVFINWDF